MKPSEVVERSSQHVCIFGEPKTGKSTLISHLTEQFNLIWFSFDNGHEVIGKLPLAQQDRIDLIRIPDTPDTPVAATTMLKVITGQRMRICWDHGAVDCPVCKRDSNYQFWTTVELNKLGSDTIVVFDPINQVAESVMAAVIRKAISSQQKDATGTEFSNSMSYEDKALFKPGRDEYAGQGFLMNRILNAIQQAPYHCICVTHVTETEREDGKKRLVPLIGTGPFSRNSPRFFDHIVYSELNNKKHTFGSSTDYSFSVITGSRSDVSIEKLTPPSLIPFFTTRISSNRAAAVRSLTVMKTEVKITDALEPAKPPSLPVAQPTIIPTVVSSLSPNIAVAVDASKTASVSAALEKLKGLKI